MAINIAGMYWICRGCYDNNVLYPQPQISEDEIYASFLRTYYKIKHHGETIFKQIINDFQQIRERKMLRSTDIVELNKKICDISDQNRMLAEMNQLGLVDSDFFISKSNELALQLQTEKQKNNVSSSLPKTTSSLKPKNS